MLIPLNFLEGVSVPQGFRFTVNTANVSTGSSNANQFRLPLINTGIYNMTVDWGDGTSDKITVWNQAERTHTYATVGIYTISIIGKCDGWLHANSGTDRMKTISILQWGNGWVLTPPTFTANGAFWSNSNLVSITALDAPILKSSIAQAFRSCINLETFNNIENWNVSGVTNMQSVFDRCNKFNSNINTWNVSNVTNMQAMFAFANAFNQPLNNWNVSKVTNMAAMFYACLVFNQDITNWDVSNVTNMSTMFYQAQLFNQNINGWNVSKVQNFNLMFGTVVSGFMTFNQPLNNWNTSAATNMSQMFEYNNAFNQNVSSWDVSKVTSTQLMFRGATSFNQPINNWNLASITTMNRMFYQLSSFNSPLSNWTIGSSINNMTLMFSQCWSFNQHLNWTFAAQPVGSGVNCTNLFQDCFAFNNGGQPLTWTIRIGSQANGMFSKCSVFNQNVGSFQFSSSLRNLSTMFYQCSAFNNGGSADINNWDLTAVTGTVNANQMFFECTSFNQPLNNLFSVAKVNDAGQMFAGCTVFNGNVGNWKFGTDIVAGKVNVEAMFVDCTAFNNGGSTSINNWDFTTVTEFEIGGFYQMFNNCTSFNQPLNNWDVSKCPVFVDMFSGCTSFNQPLNNWTFSSSLLIGMVGMFYGCSSFNQHIDWVVPNIDSGLDYMFFGCTAFNNGGQDMPLGQIFGSLGTGVGSYFQTFYGCTSFNQKINYDGATYVDPWLQTATTYQMFANCTVFNNGGSPLPLNMPLVGDCSEMFIGCTSFNQNVAVGDGISIWTAAVCNFTRMFENCVSFNNGGSSDINQPLASNYADMTAMFINTPAFNQNLANWLDQVFELTATSFMLDKAPATFPATTYDALLNGWHTSVINVTNLSNVYISFGTAEYSAAAAAAHDDLVNNYGWTIIDGGQV